MKPKKTRKYEALNDGLFAGQKCKPAWKRQGNPVFEQRRPLPIERAATQKQEKHSEH